MYFNLVMSFILLILKTFECIASAHFDESLQILEKSSGIFLGAKSGKIFKLKFDVSKLWFYN